MEVALDQLRQIRGQQGTSTKHIYAVLKELTEKECLRTRLSDGKDPLDVLDALSQTIEFFFIWQAFLAFFTYFYRNIRSKSLGKTDATQAQYLLDKFNLVLQTDNFNYNECQEHCKSISTLFQSKD